MINSKNRIFDWTVPLKFANQPMFLLSLQLPFNLLFNLLIRYIRGEMLGLDMQKIQHIQIFLFTFNEMFKSRISMYV